MVFTVHGNKFHRLAQYLQRIIQLDTFTDRHGGGGWRGQTTEERDPS